MDPAACLKRALEHFHRGDKPGLECALDDYCAWRNDGGFKPTFEIDGDELAELLECCIGALPEPEMPHSIPDDYNEC